MIRLVPHFCHDGDTNIEEHKAAEKSQKYEEEKTKTGPRWFSEKRGIQDKPLQTDIQRQRDQGETPHDIDTVYQG